MNVNLKELSGRILVMQQTSSDSKNKIIEMKKAIRKQVIKLERQNYNQKEFGPHDMVKKIKAIIEREVNNNVNK